MRTMITTITAAKTLTMIVTGTGVAAVTTHIQLLITIMMTTMMTTKTTILIAGQCLRCSCHESTTMTADRVYLMNIEQHEVPTDLQTKPTNFGHESAGCYTLHPPLPFNTNTNIFMVLSSRHNHFDGECSLLDECGSDPPQLGP